MYLIIGATGFIGNQLYEELISRGEKVCGTYINNHRDNLIRFNLGDDSAEELFNSVGFGKGYSDKVIIAGGITNINQCYQNRSKSYKVNVEGVKNVIKTSLIYGVGVVFLSSDAVFDGKKGLYSEADITNPLSEYGRQKVEIERILVDECSDALILRLSKQCGINPWKNSLFSSIHNEALVSGRVRCIEGLIFNPTFVEDTSFCIAEAIRNGLRGLYHLAAPEAISRYELTIRLLEKLGIDKRIVTEDSLDSFGFCEKKPLNTSMDCSKLNKEINYRFKTVEEMINEYNELWRRGERQYG